MTLKEFEKNPIDNPIELYGNVYYLKPLSYAELKEYVLIDCGEDNQYWCEQDLK